VIFLDTLPKQLEVVKGAELIGTYPCVTDNFSMTFSHMGGPFCVSFLMDASFLLFLFSFSGAVDFF